MLKEGDVSIACKHGALKSALFHTSNCQLSMIKNPSGPEQWPLSVFEHSTMLIPCHWL